MSLTVSHGCWLSLIVSPSPRELLHAVFNGCWLSLPVPVSCCMSLNYCRLSLTVSDSPSPSELLHVSHCLQRLPAVSHCLSLVPVSCCMTLTVYNGCWLSSTFKVGSKCTCMLHTWDICASVESVAYMLSCSYLCSCEYSLH